MKSLLKIFKLPLDKFTGNIFWPCNLEGVDKIDGRNGTVADPFRYGDFITIICTSSFRRLKVLRQERSVDYYLEFMLVMVRRENANEDVSIFKGIFLTCGVSITLRSVTADRFKT